MKLNIANPRTGLQKIIEIDDEKMLMPFFEKRMGTEVNGDTLGAEFKGYVFRISGGNDKQGFPMMQGVLLQRRARILFRKGMKTFRPRRKGHLKRKSVRGCIVGPDLSVLNLVLVRKGVDEVPGLTDSSVPRRLGPKRAGKIRKLFNLTKEDDVRKFVVRKTVGAGTTKKTKAPKIQRLITDDRLQRKRRMQILKVRKAQKSRDAEKTYLKVTTEWKNQLRAKRATELAKKKKVTPPAEAVVKPAASK
eukprot:GHVU01063348.1.p1 GENE.GHVU01063348.1~~GHVU01063348.1.p1  ORF type:complete len:248 (-),score=42.92 GHVU01063348.1:100-843(-)